MLDTLLSGPYVPFTLSLALLFGLLALELALLLIGASLMGDGGDADLGAEIDGPELDFEVDLDAIDLDGLDVDASDFDFEPELAPNAPSSPASPASPLIWLGLGRMPMLIWLATIFLSFGVAGLALQGSVEGLTGRPLNVIVATIPCGAVALWFTGQFGTLFARLLPRTESQSVSTRQLGRRMGIVTQGTATRGNPAEVRVTDRYGNTHYLRAEPMGDADTIPQGAQVLVLRHRPTGGFRLIAL